MSRSCQRATSSSPRRQIAAQHPGQAREPLRQDRVPLVGHRRAALLARPERLFDLAELAPGEVADLRRDRLDGGADRSARVEVLGVAVHGDRLGGRYRRQAEGTTDVGFDPRVDVRVGTDRAGQLPDRHPAPLHAPEALDVSSDLQGPQRELGAEGGRLGVHPVCAAGHRGVDALAGSDPGGRPISWDITVIDKSAASVSVAQSAVSTTSEEVSP